MQKKLTEDGSWTCYSDRYNQTFHSSHGAATESRQVFLQTSGVQRRLQAGKPTTVLEVGFGLGLNFLLTADLACQQRCDLQYTAYEHTLIDNNTFSDLHYVDLITDQSVYAAAAGIFAAGKGGTVAFGAGTGKSFDGQLTLKHCDFTASTLPNERFNAVYLDAFSPDSNPECWDAQSFTRLFDSLVNGGILSTYSAKGSVRRALQTAGFHVKKLPGPPGKREILQATAIKPQ